MAREGEGVAKEGSKRQMGGCGFLEGFINENSRADHLGEGSLFLPCRADKGQKIPQFR